MDRRPAIRSSPVFRTTVLAHETGARGWYEFHLATALTWQGTVGEAIKPATFDRAPSDTTGAANLLAWFV